MCFPRRCRGLTREMHLRCARKGDVPTRMRRPHPNATSPPEWDVPTRMGRPHPNGTSPPEGDVPTRMERPHPCTPQRGTLLAAHGNAVGNPAPTRSRPNGAPQKHRVTSAWEPQTVCPRFGTPFQGYVHWGMVFPRRCRGLTREMHLRCARKAPDAPTAGRPEFLGKFPGLSRVFLWLAASMLSLGASPLQNLPK
jgi:hypothetical protein